MQALIVIDAQNEFSQNGKRPVPNYLSAVEVIACRVEQARNEGRPIAWVKHFNRQGESPAFIKGTWGSEFYNGFGPQAGNNMEMEFQKDVYGAFTGSEIGSWLTTLDVESVLIVGFYTHGCVSTTARESIMAGLQVSIDPNGTGACDMTHEILGKQTADEVRRSALLHLANMGVALSEL